MVLRKEFQSSGGAVNSTGTVAELDHGCSRCLDAGAGRDETLVQLVSDNGCYQQFGSSTFPLSQPLQKYLLAKAKQVLGSSSSSSSGWEGLLGQEELALPAWPILNWQDHLVTLLLCKCQALQSHFHQLRKLLFLSVLLIHAPDKLSSLKKCPGPWLCRSFQLIEAAAPPKVRLCFRGAL